MATLYQSFAAVQIAVARALNAVNQGMSPSKAVRSFDISATAYPFAKSSSGIVVNAFDSSLPPPSSVLAADGKMYGAQALDDPKLPSGPYRFMLTLPLLNGGSTGPHSFFDLDASAFHIAEFSETPSLSPDLSFTVPEVKGTVADVLGANPTSPLKGTGIIVGIIDYGFDFAHPNFIKPDGTTRLIALWDQNPGTGTLNQFQVVLDDLKPTGGWQNTSDNHATSYIYSPAGQFQSSPGRVSPATAEKSLNDLIKSATPYQFYDPHNNYFAADGNPSPTADAHGAHGTHVADIAAGNGAATGRPGIAPEADILFVQLPPPDATGGAPDARYLLDAVHFIANYAQKNNKQAVINLSLNGNSGLHDASDLTVAALDAYAAGTFSTTGVNQRVPIVVSAGNQFVLAREPMKLGRDPDGTTSPATNWNKKYRETMAQRIDMKAAPPGNTFYWLFRRRRNGAPNTRSASLEIWYRTSAANTDTVTVEVSSRGNGGAKLVTLATQAPPAILSATSVDIKDQTGAGAPVGKISFRGALPGANMPRRIRIDIFNPNTLTWGGANDVVGTLTVKLTTTSATGRAHVFVERAGINDPAQTSLILRTVNATDDIPDDDLATRIGHASTLGTLSCGTSVIAVGAYFAPDRSGANAEIAEFSSSGPPVNYLTLDEPALPEAGALEQPWVSAPGAIVLAARSKGGRIDTPPVDMAVIMSGTSMAAPHVAGTIALMLEKTPGASTAALRDALRRAARHDYAGASPLGQLWHKRFGHGRLNVAASIKNI